MISTLLLGKRRSNGYLQCSDGKSSGLREEIEALYCGMHERMRGRVEELGWVALKTA